MEKIGRPRTRPLFKQAEEHNRKVDSKHNLTDLSILITSLIKNSNSPAEASGKIVSEIKSLLEQRINSLIAGPFNKEDLIKRLVEFKAELK